MTYKEKCEKVKTLREQGKTYQEIADELGYRKQQIEEFCRRESLGYSEEERHRAMSENRKGKTAYNKGKVLADWEEKVNIKFDGLFELVKVGNTKLHSERDITVRCRQCGIEKTLSSQSFKGECGKHGHCENCERKTRQINRQLENQKIKLKKEKSRIKRILEDKQIKINFCRRCGQVIDSGYRYCDDCREKVRKEAKQKEVYKYNKAISYRAEKKRKERIKGVKSDHIKLSDLYLKFDGICWLCGEKCEWTDGYWKNNAFHTGKRYPSQDHVIPLAKGGEDTWENSRLAHVSCNSKKGTKLVDENPPIPVGKCAV